MSIVEPEKEERKGRRKKAAKAATTPAARSARGRKVPPAAAELSASAEPKAPLVLLTKSSAAFREVIDEKTFEIQGFRLDNKRREYVHEKDDLTARSDARTGRFVLQNEARKLLVNKETPKGTKWRVTRCARSVNGSDVAVLFSPSVKRAHFGNLQICGSVWTCPPCAAKVGERRKAEVVAASDLHVEAGGGLYMMTYTFAHQREEQCPDLVKRLRVALTWMRKHRRYKKLVQYAGFVGLIRALEVTHGEANGWHPHVHELWLTTSPLSRAVLRLVQKDLFELWRDACNVAGLGTPNRKAGVTCIEAYSGAQYVAKFGRETTWGTGAELTKSHTKRGRKASRTPFDLLRLSADGDKRAGSLFIQFADAFFGSRQLYWSPGLKAAFQIAEISDEEAASMQEHDAQVVCMIDKSNWKALLRLPYEARGIVLDLAENGGTEAVQRFLSTIKAHCNSSEASTTPDSVLSPPLLEHQNPSLRPGRTSGKHLPKNVDPLPFWLADAKTMLEQASDLPSVSKQFLRQLQGIPNAFSDDSAKRTNVKHPATLQGCFDFSPHNSP